MGGGGRGGGNSTAALSVLDLFVSSRRASLPDRYGVSHIRRVQGGHLHLKVQKSATTCSPGNELAWSVTMARRHVRPRKVRRWLQKERTLKNTRFEGLG